MRGSGFPIMGLAYNSPCHQHNELPGGLCEQPAAGATCRPRTFANGNDSATTERSRKMLNITHDTSEFLAVLVRATVARRVLEIGTSNGYSTLWLSAAQAIGSSVTTVVDSPTTRSLCRQQKPCSVRISLVYYVYSRRRGSSARTHCGFRVRFHISRFRASRISGLVGQFEQLLRPGGLLVVDNATSHPRRWHRSSLSSKPILSSQPVSFPWAMASSWQSKQACDGKTN